LIASDG